jgi:hypothetical protein
MLDALNIQHTVSFAVQHGNFAAAGIKPKGEARGGLTSMVPGNGPGDHHLLSLDGTPVARVESSEGIFVGNRNMMGALGAMNAAVPRRAKGGGLTEPQMSGPPPLSTIGQKSIHLMYQAAKKYVAKLGGDKSMAAIVKNANRMDSLHQPYLWGGGHGSSASTGGPWDCSGAISELFNGAGWHFAPMVSGGFSSWGLPGRGKVSVLSNPEHVYAVIGNRAFGTSEENPGGGAGWISGYTYRSGFNTTHADLMNPMAAFHGGKRGKGQKAKHGLAAGGVVGQVGAILARNGLDRDAIAGILGNAFGESGYNPAAQESESAGGLWGFTAGAKSLASLKAYAAKIGVPWTNVKAQTQFMLHNFTSSERSAINALSGTDATTKWFMENWERPESMSSLGKRQSAAASALGSLGGTTASKAEKKIPASKRQKHTIGALQHRGAGVLKEAQQLKGQFKKYGGTKRGKLALERALKLAKEIKQAVKVGDTSRAKSLITKYRSVLGKARGSLKSAGEGVFTPGLKAAALPPLATSAFVAGQPFSEANLPGFAELPEGILKALKSPGLKAAGQYGVLEGALTMAGQTETKTDDAAVYNAMLGIAQGQKKGLKKRLAEVNKKLKGGGLTKAAREKLKETQGNILTALGTTQGRIVSAREGIAGLNEGEEEEKKEREEALIAATTELAQTQKGLADELRETRELSESAIATGSEVAWRALADKLSGNLGVRVITNSRTAGIGTVGRS